MDRECVRELAARFIAEAEADINFGLAEGLDPRHEYSMLVARLRGEEFPQPSSPPELAGAEKGTVSPADVVVLLISELSESPGPRQLAQSRTGL